MKIALAGNPNSGKTTIYNALTGKSGDVGNWAGVTVDKKEARIRRKYSRGKEITLIDLPGAYSMSAFSGEEGITRDFVLSSGADLIINVIDADNLSRGLFFTTELLELEIPVVAVLNKIDLNEKRGTEIDTHMLEKLLGCPVVSCSAERGVGLSNLLNKALSGISIKREGVPKFQTKAERYNFINKTVSSVERRVASNDGSFGDKLDAVLINKWLGIPIFALVMLLVFYISQATLGTWLAEGVTLGTLEIPGLVTLLELFSGFVASLFEGANPLLLSILVDGVLGGVTAVVGFLPLVMVMYFLIALLEDCGYMSRAAAVLDPIFKRVGLSGKSVIPFVISIGCTVPGIMASRTIKNERERRATVLLSPFMPCGAKIPVIALIAGAFFGNAWWVSALAYFLGILFIFIGALLVNLITGYRARKKYFIIELVDYKIPSISGALKSTLSRGLAYIVKAGTIILLCNMAVEIMQSFTFTLKIAENPDSSILAQLSSPLSYLFTSIFGTRSWELTSAVITGFIAKENVVGTLAVCLGDASIPLTPIGALSYLFFNLYAPPCFAAIGAMNAEMKSRRWLIFAVSFQLALGYTVSYLVYTVGTLLFTPSLFDWHTALIGFITVLVFFTVFAFISLSKRKRG
jgi:ferrous iron transport protein B